ncbi:glycosyltransferase family 4 protein [Clostridium gasigenes]|uniref:glycosyltransferase family 4 protein n=1 Tax=Clostridium gasigenes TaxID=94869 RepID=UPI001C0E08F8|nr:glycosyltransferase family 4 protein [Clostridium gasigenes]MBU3107657.1 glycosyltransferase family 4 protein [Clostridium gasigenes]
MNILYTIFSFNIGGAERLVFDIVNNWNNEHDDNIFLCIINNEYDKDLVEKLNSNSKIKVIYLNRPKGGAKLRYIVEYMKFIKQNNIDIVHCQCIDSVKFTCLSKAIKPKIKIYHTVHDTTIYKMSRKLDIFIDKLFTNKIVAISDAVKDEILSRGIKDKKVIRIYNGINTEEFKRIKKSHNDINIVCVARIMPEKKGQDILIKAMSVVTEEYNNVKCYFAGSEAQGDKNKIDYLKDIVIELGLENNIFFLGNVIDVPLLLSEMDIFVLPSRYEGFGLVIIEAMISKLIIIASDLDGPKELLQNNKYGDLFECNNHNELAKKILKNLDNRNEEIIENAYTYAIDNFDIKIMIDNLKRLYTERS